LIYRAWVVIANVSEGDWTKQPDVWQTAAADWRDEFHKAFGHSPPAAEETTT
jgi:hypothetical protein